MSEANKKQKRAIAIGVVGLASIMGVATVGLVIGTSLGLKPTANSTKSDIEWAKIATDKMVGAGFFFATAAYDANTVKINGDAKSQEERASAFASGRDAILEKAKAEHAGPFVFENAITVNGEKIDELPDALSGLSEKPEEKECQSAYDTLLSGHTINFNSGSAVIKPDSQPLLNALSDIAKKCVDYRVEIGGHTDTKGDAIANQTLSENRAQAVADYLFGKGVVKDQLAIKGYGENMPKDTSQSADADAKNRRIEFKVSKKPE